MEIILGFLQGQNVPHLQSSNKQSLCVKLSGLIEKSRELITPIGHEFYWSNSIVPMINKKYVETKSNFNTEVKRLYISEFEDVAYQII